MTFQGYDTADIVSVGFKQTKPRRPAYLYYDCAVSEIKSVIDMKTLVLLLAI